MGTRTSPWPMVKPLLGSSRNRSIIGHFVAGAGRVKVPLKVPSLPTALPLKGTDVLGAIRRKLELSRRLR